MAKMFLDILTYRNSTDVLRTASRPSTRAQSEKIGKVERSFGNNWRPRSQKHSKRCCRKQPDFRFIKAANRGPMSLVKDFSKLMEGVVFTISGLVNPERSELRKMALEMGAQYRPSWSDDSTLLVSALFNTPTFKQVQAAGGTIVNKDWVTKSYNQKELVAIEKYLMHVGNPWRTGHHVDDSASLFESDIPVQQSNNHQQHDLSVKGQKPALWRSRTKDPQKNLASRADVEQWVLDDLAASLTWLEQQSEKPEECERESVAGQGLLVCMEDAVKSLQEDKVADKTSLVKNSVLEEIKNLLRKVFFLSMVQTQMMASSFFCKTFTIQGLSLVMDNWAFIPRAVKELATSEENGQCGRDELVKEGKRLKVIYELKLKKLGIIVDVPQDDGSLSTEMGKDGSKGVGKCLSPQPVVEDEDLVDDDATEIISDVDSRDPADFDSDDTQELGEEEVTQYQQKILQTFTLY